MKTRLFQFLAFGLLAFLVILAALTVRPQEEVQSAGIPVTGNTSSAIDFNNPLGLSVDPYMYPKEADSIDLQSEQYRQQYQFTEPVDSRPFLSIDFNNPIGIPVDPNMYPNVVNSIDRQIEQYRHLFNINESSNSQSDLIFFDMNDPLGLSIYPNPTP